MIWSGQVTALDLRTEPSRTVKGLGKRDVRTRQATGGLEHSDLYFIGLLMKTKLLDVRLNVPQN